MLYAFYSLVKNDENTWSNVAGIVRTTSVTEMNFKLPA